jgi:hypothetical protein
VKGFSFDTESIVSLMSVVVIVVVLLVAVYVLRRFARTRFVVWWSS